MKVRTATKKHKRPCDYCGDSIQPSDRFVQWCWVNEDWEGPGSRGPYGGIMRVHETCHLIARREHLAEERFNCGCVFEEADEERYNGNGNDPTQDPTALADEASAALENARKMLVEPALAELSDLIFKTPADKSAIEAVALWALSKGAKL